MFGEFLQGVRLIDDLNKNEAFLYVPNKCIISTEAARLSPIGHLFDSHESLFVTNQDRDSCILMVQIIYEKLKGDDSFYSPYFKMVDSPVPTCYWSADLIKQSDLREFRLGLDYSRDKCEQEWTQLSEFFA